MDSISFGELIRARRISRNLSLREVAARVDLDQSVLSKIERDKMRAPARAVLPLSRALEFDYEYLQTKYWSERLFRELKDLDFGAAALEMALKRLEKERSGTSADLSTDHLIYRISEYVDDQPIEKVWLFGSFSRGEASYDSDIDLLVRFDPEKKLDLFDYIGIKQDLEDLTGRRVDLVEEGQEKEKIKPTIEREKKLIYERQAD